VPHEKSSPLFGCHGPQRVRIARRFLDPLELLQGHGVVALQPRIFLPNLVKETTTTEKKKKKKKKKKRKK
jgi:hypothetical protein